MIFGYARISTDDQSLDAQTDALQGAGAERIFADRISGSLSRRPELARLLDQVRQGDVIVVTKYDRLARRLRDLLEIVEAIKECGGGFRSLAEDIDTTTPAGRLSFHVFASIAQFERERISERSKEGLESARRRGRVGAAPRRSRPSSGPRCATCATRKAGPYPAGLGAQGDGHTHPARRRPRAMSSEPCAAAEMACGRSGAVL